MNEKVEYQIRKYTPDLKEKVTQLYSSSWGIDDQLVCQYLHWKYQENPYFSEPIIIVAMHSQEVVGMRGFYGSEWEYGQPPKRIFIPCAADLVIAPGHRNRGLFTRIMDVAEDELSRAGFCHIFNLNPVTATVFGALTMGWHRLGSMEMMRWSSANGSGQRTGIRNYLAHIPLMASVYRNLKRIAIRFPKTLTHDSGRFTRLDKYRDSLGTKSSECLLIEKSPRILEMTELIQSIRYSGRLRHVRDPRFFRWKYNNPMIVNRFLYYFVNEVLQGYLVLQLPKRGNSRSPNIMDWEATDPQIGGELLKAAINLGDFRLVNIWTATLPDHTIRFLNESGFRFLDEPSSVAQAHRTGTYRPNILVKSIRNELSGESECSLGSFDIYDIKNWDLRMTYSDSH